MNSNNDDDDDDDWLIDFNSMSGIILCREVRELHTLYIYIYIFV